MSDDDRRLGAYAPPPDDYETFDARDAEQDRRGWLFLAAAAVVFVLFVAVVYNTFQLGVRERSDSPVITADAEPYRVAPEEGDAAEADLGVHSLRSGDRGAGGDDAAPARAVSEEPQALPDVRIETADADEIGSDAADAGPETSAAEAEPEEAAPTERPASERSIEDVIAERERDRAEEPATREPEPEPEPEPVRPAPEPAPASQAEPGVEQPYLAQIAAFRSLEDAEADWRRFARAFPDLASGRNADIQRADLGERGVYYRLRINGFESREAANAYCGTLQVQGQACLVARR